MKTCELDVCHFAGLPLSVVAYDDTLEIPVSWQTKLRLATNVFATGPVDRRFKHTYLAQRYP